MPTSHHRGRHSYPETEAEAVKMGMEETYLSIDPRVMTLGPFEKSLNGGMRKYDRVSWPFEAVL